MADTLPEAKPSCDCQRKILTVQMVMIAVMSALTLLSGKVPGLDMLGLILLTLFLWGMRDKIAFLDFAPFLLMLYTYEVVRSVILAVGTDGLHVADLVALEKTLCAGIIPSSALQRAVDSTSFSVIVDVVANSFYMTHFFSVILAGVVIWSRRKAHYWPYIMGLILLSYCGFLTYVFFPAAPPWWASMNGYLGGQPVNLDHSLLSPSYIFASANALGAMPSLHSAWPFYLFFYCLYVWGRKALPVVVLPLGVAVSSIYLGHHYVVDVLGGIAYASVAFGIAVAWGKSYLEARETAGKLATV
jgi:membrane-associated phospholipid phosphatase